MTPTPEVFLQFRRSFVAVAVIPVSTSSLLVAIKNNLFRSAWAVNLKSTAKSKRILGRCDNGLRGGKRSSIGACRGLITITSKRERHCPKIKLERFASSAHATL
jgi:hypothetical protein